MHKGPDVSMSLCALVHDALVPSFFNLFSLTSFFFPIFFLLSFLVFSFIFNFVMRLLSPLCLLLSLLGSEGMTFNVIWRQMLK